MNISEILKNSLNATNRERVIKIAQYFFLRDRINYSTFLYVMTKPLKNQEREAYSARMERVEKEKERERVTTKNSVERTLPPQTSIPPFDSPSTNTSRKSTIVNLIPTKKLV